MTNTIRQGFPVRNRLTGLYRASWNRGQVVWLSHGMFESSCHVSVEYFPFDIQSCSMKWSSWTYDGYSVGSFPTHFLLVTPTANL